MPQPNWKINVGLAKESTWGTAVTPATTFLSSPTPQFAEKQDPIFDKGLRGIRSETQSMTFGAGHTEIDLPDMPWYGDDSGHLLMALMGSDAVTVASTKSGTAGALSAGATSITYTLVGGAAPVTGDAFKLDTGTAVAETVVTTAVSGGGPYTLTVPAIKFSHSAAAPMAGLNNHTMTVLNSGAPPSYTFQKYDALVATARTVAGVYLEELTLKFTNPGRLTVAAKGRGKMGTNVTAPTAAFSPEPFNVPWQAAFTVAGAANARIVDYELSLKAPADQIFGMNGSQSPTGSVPDQLTVAGKFTVVPDDYTEYNYYLNNTQPAVSVLIDNGATRTVFQMSKVAFIDPATINHSGNYSMVEAAFEAIANPTDAGTGNAPIKALLYNLRTTVY